MKYYRYSKGIGRHTMPTRTIDRGLAPLMEDDPDVTFKLTIQIKSRFLINSENPVRTCALDKVQRSVKFKKVYMGAWYTRSIFLYRS